MNKLFQFFDTYLLKIGVSFILLFTALYPKFPSIGIQHTWVYIRLEDFLILAVTVLWLVQLLRKKVTLPLPIGWSIVAYWMIGLISLLFSLLIIAPHLANFFPKVAVLQYIRRIEYMILFFVGYSSVRTKKDIRDYLIILSITVGGLVLYGLGQKYYILLWHSFPKFFEKNSFCFPSIQTTNEEFAKGQQLCLPPDARITSTFGGHYDLAAYLVLVIPLLVGTVFTVKKWILRVLLSIVSIGSIMVLIFTASRVSFVAYLIGVSFMFIFLKKKKFILPIILISIFLLLTFSSATAKRFQQTIRLTSIVTDTQGQIVGETTASLPKDLQKKISKNPVVLEAPPPTQNLPQGSGFIALPAATTPVATSVAVVEQKLPTTTSKKLKLAYGAVEISTVSGSFLIQKALVYDISFTTRFQGEWPHAWAAFMTNPPLGTGFSSITLASDNDYLRALGESGFLGLGSFLFVFVVLGILLQQSSSSVKDSLARAFIFGLAGGVIGLFINAVLIDVFEASKVAEPLWMLLGIGAGVLHFYYKSEIDYRKQLKEFFTSNILIAFYLFIILLIFFVASISNFFVADDFTWLRWAASSTIKDIPQYFTHAQGFFYRPLDKVVMFFLYIFFSFQPEGYHFFNLTLHFLVAFGLYLLGSIVVKNKFIAFISAVFFLLLPAHGETIYWISSISILLSSVFIIYGLLFFYKARENKSIISYIFSLLFQILALLSYEMAIIYPLLVIIIDSFLVSMKKTKSALLYYVPFIILSLIYIPVRAATHAVSIGGDYSVNISHLIPNFFGNLFGYISLLALGENFLTFYGHTRETMKMYAGLTGGFLILFILVLCIGFILQRKKLLSILKKHTVRMFAFSLLFMVIALAPFIGLGNITERYAYLASVGFILICMVISAVVRDVIKTYSSKLSYLLIILIALILVFWYEIQLIQENQEWYDAGIITYNTLSLFRTKYSFLPHNSYVTFMNVPIRKKEAWVFPVGLEDGLWFIYRDPTITVSKVKSIDEAKALHELANTKLSPKFILFSFDEEGDLSEVNE